jgi:hypothetical protein
VGVREWLAVLVVAGFLAGCGDDSDRGSESSLPADVAGRYSLQHGGNREDSEFFVELLPKTARECFGYTGGEKPCFTVKHNLGAFEFGEVGAADGKLTFKESISSDRPDDLDSECEGSVGRADRFVYAYRLNGRRMTLRESDDDCRDRVEFLTGSPLTKAR